MVVNSSWIPVCDHGFNDVMARAVCRHLGYTDGIAQCCSAVGDVINSDYVLSDACSAGPEDLTKCRHTVGACPGGRYASAYCSKKNISVNNLNASMCLLF